jgi:type I restriction enzyme S subunit
MITSRPKDRWPLVPLGTLAEFRNGINFSKANFGSGIKVIGVSDFQNNVMASFDNLEQINPEGVVRKEHLLKNGDILFVRSNGNRDLIGRSMFVDGLHDGITHSAFSIRLRFVTETCHPRFYAYLFRSHLIRQALSLHGGGTNISNLNQDILGRLQVPLPPKSVQCKLASILTAYDDLIENNTRRIEILEDMAQMIYREWFVHFRFPGHARIRMVESEMGPIPGGWSIKRICDFGRVITGKTPSTGKAEFFGGNVPFIKTPDMHGNVFCLGSGDYLSDLGAESQMNKTVPPNSIIVNCIGALAGSVSITTMSCQTNQQINSLVLRDQRDREFLYISLARLREALRQIGSNGATMINVNKGKFESLLVLAPPSDHAQTFHERMFPIFEQIRNFQSRNINLRQTRDLLLPKLVSGEVTVENCEAEAVAQGV